MKSISSVDTDPKNSTSMMYYGWVKIKNGRIDSIHDETGRDGGELWSRKRGSLNGSVKQVMAGIGRNWPNLYKKVRRLCPKDNLPPITTVQRKATKRALHMVESNIEDHEVQLRELKAKRRKLKAKL